MVKGKIFKNKTVILTVALLGLLIIIGTSFALWNLTFRQTGTNQINTSCFKIDFTENDDINMSNAYPLTDEEASNLSPYTFTITNICDTSATYQVNLEELEVEEKKLSNQYINLSLNDKTGKLSTFEEVTKTIDNATTSHKLTTGVLKSKEEKSFELRLWLRDDAPSTEEVMNASFLSKVTVITVYKKNIPEVNSLAYENLDTIKVDVNTISNPDNEALTYYYQLDDNEEIKSTTPNYTFPNLQDGTYKVKVRVEDSNGIVIFDNVEDVVVAYVHVYISSTGNDTTGNGSPASPYATLQRAYNKVKSGGEILLSSNIIANSTTNMNTTNKIATIKSDGSNTYSVSRGSSLKTPILDIRNSNNITTTNIIFDGKNIEANSASLEVRSSTLNIQNNTTIENNINCGEYLAEWNSTAATGGGIYAYSSTVNITGGVIQNNQVRLPSGDTTRTASGGGIHAGKSTLNIYSATIIGNSAVNGNNPHGGGVDVWMSNFNFYDGTISGNKSEAFSGVFLGSQDKTSVTMTMTGGKIINNQATNVAGGLGVNGTDGASVIAYIKGGTISNNTASSYPDMYADLGGQIIDQR